MPSNVPVLQGKVECYGRLDRQEGSQEYVEGARRVPHDDIGEERSKLLKETENPRVGGSIPSLATLHQTPQVVIKASTALMRDARNAGTLTVRSAARSAPARASERAVQRLRDRAQINARRGCAHELSADRDRDVAGCRFQANPWTLLAPGIASTWGTKEEPFVRCLEGDFTGEQGATPQL